MASFMVVADQQTALRDAGCSAKSNLAQSAQLKQLVLSSHSMTSECHVTPIMNTIAANQPVQHPRAADATPIPTDSCIRKTSVPLWQCTRRARQQPALKFSTDLYAEEHTHATVAAALAIGLLDHIEFAISNGATQHGPRRATIPSCIQWGYYCSLCMPIYTTATAAIPAKCLAATAPA